MPCWRRHPAARVNPERPRQVITTKALGYGWRTPLSRNPSFAVWGCQAVNARNIGPGKRVLRSCFTFALLRPKILPKIEVYGVRIAICLSGARACGLGLLDRVSSRSGSRQGG